MVQLSKTEARDSLKAGHPPAVKAGGKRVVKKTADDNSNVDKETKKFDKTRSLSTPSRMQHLGLLLAGPLEKFNRDYPEIPVSVRHSRVRPSVEKPHAARIPCIQQPRKF
ncbi:death-associated protein-like 1 homolog [Pseudorasbora parva]|uniref:death-associated protein-like 1 homolog n=1 Tax=Pseudorasbora parva TaxID=51549 RepID=UPI00351F425A